MPKKGEKMKNITRARKEVMAIANRLRKKIGNLSDAVRHAWQVVKDRLVVCRIAGVSFGNRQAALRRLQAYAPEQITVRMGREPGNAHDRNAVAIYVAVTGDEYKIGYMPKDMAELLAPIMDMGINLQAKWRAVTGGYEMRETYGGLIAVEL